MAGEMDFSDPIAWHRVDIAQRVEAMIGGGDIDVVHIKQYRAAATPRELGEKIPFGDRRSREFQIAR